MLYDTIKEKRETAKMESRLKSKKSSRKETLSTRTEADAREQLEYKGYNADKAIESMLNVKKGGQKRGRSEVRREDASMEMDEEMGSTSKPRGRGRSQSNGRGQSVVRSEGRARSKTPSLRSEGSVPAAKRKQVIKDDKVLSGKCSVRPAGGPADREHYPKMVKHMMSGKRPGYGTKTIGR